MKIKLSQRVNRVKPSPTLAVSARAAELRAAGKDIIGLGVGEPDFETPENIKDAAITAIRQGETRYTAVDGTPTLKQSIINKFRRDNKLDYEPGQILVSCGGKQSFYNMCQAMLDSSDEVIIPAPYWVSYPDMVLLADGTPVFIMADKEQGFKIQARQLEAALNEKTRLFVINSPSNPTGVAYQRHELEALAAVLRQYPDVLIATDDMYEHMLWSEEGFSNILSVAPDLYDRTIILNGVSKAYAMTGWRIGYAAGPAKLIRNMKKIQSQSTSNPASISQAAAREALDGDQSSVRKMLLAFRERHDYLIAALNKIPGISCLPADGTFYAFPDISGAIAATGGVNNDLEFAEYLLNEAGVAIVPGSAFGAEGYMRLSFAVGLDTLKDAVGRINKVLSKQ
ncbi:MAG TPA: pyridoxal phosphate-dependent aminotransferase [Gammaproteobacteria bacterium]|nr:pyridoxal phosphate-dependent aminotransferase [Gammaproteobacteria bacterium]